MNTEEFNREDYIKIDDDSQNEFELKDKVMTIEEKARAYDDALKRAKYALNTDMDNSGHWAVNYIFPELKEFEDDKIKKDDDSQNEFELIQD